MQGARHKDGAGEELPFPAGPVSAKLLDWYGRAGRDLPWRQTRDPYRIWLSEIMLQQTTVAAVVGYYLRFLERFPEVKALAAASLEEVIDLWAGLGYYARARNLHKAACQVVDDFGGQFPSEVEMLMSLAGIGRSTAGAIAALAFEVRAPILDANVRRVLCRLFALQELPRSAGAEKKLWAWAELLTPESRVHDYTQAIMDLGALVCTPRNPDCENCPLRDLCQAREHDLVEQLPCKAAKKEIPLRRQLALLLVSDDQCLIQRRPVHGLLGGLWEFPTLEDEVISEEARIRRFLGGEMKVTEIKLLGQTRHTYSHFRLVVSFYRVGVQKETCVAEERSCWLPLTKLEGLALHGAHKKLLPLIGY